MGLLRIQNLDADSRTLQVVVFVATVASLVVFFPIYLVRDSGALFLGIGISLAAIAMSVVVATAIKVHKVVRSEW